MSHWPLRVRAFLDENYATVVAALVVLALFGGWLTYGAYASPGTHTEERTASSWQTTGQFDHGATVTEENPVFPVGTRLSNRTTYFRSVAPVLNGTFRTGYADAESADLSATVNVTLVLRSVDSEDGSKTEYWRTTRQLGRQRVDSLAPGQSVRVPFSVDVNALGNRTQEIRNQLGGQPGQVTASVRATVRYAGTVEDRSVDRTVEYRLPLAIDGGTYRVEDPGAVRERHEETRTVTVTDDVDPISGFGGPFLLSSSLAAALAVVAARRRNRLGLTPEEREWLDFREDRSDFDEWIVRMRLPDEALDLPRAEAETLADLVDFAIDTDNAVVEHPDTGTFAVVHDEYRYIYVPPSNPVREDGVDDRNDSDSKTTGDVEDEVDTAEREVVAE